MEVTTDTPGLTQLNSNKKVSLSLKRRGSRHGVTVMHRGCYANGFQFDSHLANFNLNFFFTFFQAYVLPLRVSVRLG